MWKNVFLHPGRSSTWTGKHLGDSSCRYRRDLHQWIPTAHASFGGESGRSVPEVKSRMEWSLIQSLWIEVRLQRVLSASSYTSGPRRKNGFMFIPLLELDNVP